MRHKSIFANKRLTCMRKLRPTRELLTQITDSQSKIQESRQKAEEDGRAQNERIAQLEQMVQAQAQHNLKLHSMIDSQLAQARPAPIVETKTKLLPQRTFADTALSSHTAKASAATPPSMFTPSAPFLARQNASSFPSGGHVLGSEGEDIQITYMDPRLLGWAGNDVFDKADEEILMWVRAGIKEAEEEAARGRVGHNRLRLRMLRWRQFCPPNPHGGCRDRGATRPPLPIREEPQQAEMDGFSTATVESIELPGDEEATEADIEIVPDIENLNWNVVESDCQAIINPLDEKTKEDEIAMERQKEVEGLNTILTLTSAIAMSSETVAAGSSEDKTFTRMEGSVTVHPFMEGSVEVIRMEVAENAPKKDDKEIRECESGADAPEG
eukprot:s3086_g15.t1